MSVRISGDTLALDRKLVRRINRHADTLRQAMPNHSPGQPLDLQVRIAEEFDQLRGHRVRCELIANLSPRRQIIVREAQKKAEEAIDTAFSGLKSKMKRHRIRAAIKPPTAEALRPTGT
jgi:ribosome-associated translation inhibitor RaiA